MSFSTSQYFDFEWEKSHIVSFDRNQSWKWSIKSSLSPSLGYAASAMDIDIFQKEIKLSCWELNSKNDNLYQYTSRWFEFSNFPSSSRPVNETFEIHTHEENGNTTSITALEGVIITNHEVSSESLSSYAVKHDMRFRFKSAKIIQNDLGNQFWAYPLISVDSVISDLNQLLIALENSEPCDSEKH